MPTIAQASRPRGLLALTNGDKSYILGSAIARLSQQYDWTNILVRVAHESLMLIANELMRLPGWLFAK